VAVPSGGGAGPYYPVSMTFLPMTSEESIGSAARSVRDEQHELHGAGIANLRATLLTHVPSFSSYMSWYTLRDALAPYIGDRAVLLFSYAISDENDCLVCAVYFRRMLIESGEDPDNPLVTETEQLLITWGRLISKSPSSITADFYGQLESAFNPTLRVLLVAFAGQTVAMNLFATVGKVPLDEELVDYRKPGDDRTS
jgi:hypothetical protein